MSQCEVVATERFTAANTTSSTYATTDSLPAANFVTGKKYLILLCAEMRGVLEGNSPYSGLRLLHGSTPFAGSEHLHRARNADTDCVMVHFHTVWTAVAGEGLAVQTHSCDGANTSLNWMKLVAIRLSDSGLTENTDWYFNENTTPLTLTGTPTDGASITFTPGTGGQNWLVIADAQVTLGDTAEATGDRAQSLLVLDGSGVYTASQKWGMAGEQESLPNVWVGTLTAVSHTFKEQASRSAANGSTDQRLTSRIFAINLAKFDVASIYSSDAAVYGATTDWAVQGGTVSHTQAIADGNVLLLGYYQWNPGYSSGTRRYSRSRLQIDEVDSWSNAGANTYTNASTKARFQVTTDLANAEARYPWIHYSLKALSATAHALDHDFNGSATAAFPGRTFRVVAISLDVSYTPPASGGGTTELERNTQTMFLNDYVAARRRVMVRCVSSSDHATPITNAAGSQPSISKNGAAFTTTGVATLTAVDATNGLYYTELTTGALDTLGSLRVEVKPTGADLFSVTLPVEVCPWLNDGIAQSGSANTIGLQNPPSALAAGSIVRLVSGTGAGQSAVVTGYSNPTVTIEGTWTTNPVASDTGYVVEPGLPPTIPQVNPVQLDGDSTALQNLKAGARAMLTGTLVTGTNNQTTLTTNLPITVGGVTTPANFYKGRALYMRDGPQQGDVAMVTGSAVSGSNTVLTVDVLTGSPAVGNTFVLC